MARYGSASQVSLLGRGISPGVKWLIVGYFAIYLGELVARLTLGDGAVAYLFDYVALTPRNVVTRLNLWQLATYMTVHDPFDPGHIIFNMIGLYFLGTPLEQRWGTRDFLRFYFLSGTLAGVAVTVVGLVFGHTWPALWLAPTLGSSGADFALVAAFGILYADAQILLSFVIPVRARYILPVLLGISALFTLAGSNQSFSAHAGGALAGWLLITGNWRPGRLIGRARTVFDRWRWRRARRHLRSVDDDRGPTLH